MPTGNAIQLIGGPYTFEPPKPPSDEKQIINFNLPKKDQHWRIPKDIYMFREMSISQKKVFVDRERDRWLNGCYFLNNGELEYLTGPHYDYLTYGTFDFGKPRFLKSQQHDFFFNQLIKKDPFSFGKCVIKPRRYGYTSIEISDDIYCAIEGFDRHVGMVSNEFEKTKRTLFSPLVDSYIKRPSYLRPSIYTPNGKKPRKELLFQSMNIRDFGKLQQNADITSLDLNSWIIPGTTTVIVFDGMKLHKLTADEIWKWVGVSPMEFWDIHRKCLEDGGQIIGKASLLSTMGDSDDYAEAIADGVKIWYNSDPEVRDLNGRTASGLYRWFISGIYSMRAAVDVYGEVNKDQAEAMILNDLAKYPEGTKEYIFEKRRMPLTIEDALLGADSSSIFDNVRLKKREQEIIYLPAEQKPYVTGRLEFIDSKSLKVKFVPDRMGDWQVAYHPFRNIDKNIDTANRFMRRGSEYVPPVNPEYGIGYDPVMFADVDTVTGNKSEAAIIVRQKFDYYGNGNAGRFAAIMSGRPEDPDIAHWELLKACLYWGAPAMIERNCMGACKKIFISKKCLSFLLRNPKDGIVGTFTDNQHRVVNWGVNRFQSYIKKPKLEDEPDMLDLLQFDKMISQAIHFRANKTKVFDIFMGNIQCELALDQIQETSVRDMRSVGINNFSFFAFRNR